MPAIIPATTFSLGMNNATIASQLPIHHVYSAAVTEIISRREKEIESLEGELQDLRDFGDKAIRKLQERAEEQLEMVMQQMDKIKRTRKQIREKQDLSSKEQARIKAKIKHLKRSNDVLRSSKSPMSRAPDEVFSLIFQEFVAMDELPWYLTRISIRWRKVAITTPSLWGYIQLADSSHGLSFTSFNDRGTLRSFHGKTSLCFTVDALRLVLRYSGTTALHVTVTGICNNGTLIDSLIATLKVVAKPKVIKRVESLMIDVRYNEDEDGPRPHFVPEGFLLAPLPNLQRLRVSNGMSQQWKDELFESISLFTRNLRDLSVSTDLTTIKTLSDEAWGNIRVLNIDVTTNLDNYLQKLTNLEELNGIILNWPGGDTPRCSYPNLRHLNAFAHPKGFRRVQFPNLERLIVTDSSEEDEIIDNSTLEFAEFPALTKLSLYDSNNPAKWFSNTSMPLLTDLRIHISARSFELPPLGTFTKLRVLDIRSTSTDVLIVGLLGYLPNLECLGAVPWTYSNIIDGFPSSILSPYHITYGIKLVTSLCLGNNGLMRCKNLQSLTLGASDARLQTRKHQLVPLIKRLMFDRRGAEYPLLTVGVWWRMGEQAQVFL
ncbi:hypothetical protein CPB86DRAFT_799464 [Serendipita vermifera]|nr:hypothetical protein CPB86DRAFT_799464 [Serendipita vermifera]